MKCIVVVLNRYIMLLKDFDRKNLISKKNEINKFCKKHQQKGVFFICLLKYKKAN